MSVHLWQAALDKARQRRGQFKSSPSRGDLGLTIGEWCDVLEAAVRYRRERIGFTVVLVSATLVAFLVGRLFGGAR